jgi:hypothetical protein
MNCTLCQDCAETCPQKPSAIKADWEKNAFIFGLESSGALPPEKIMMEAIKILDGHLKELGTQIKVKKSEQD